MKLSSMIKSMFCSQTSPIGDVLERIAGEATECWCCSMVRGIAVGFVLGVIITGIVGTVL